MDGAYDKRSIKDRLIREITREKIKKEKIGGNELEKKADIKFVKGKIKNIPIQTE